MVWLRRVLWSIPFFIFFLLHLLFFLPFRRLATRSRRVGPRKARRRRSATLFHRFPSYPLCRFSETTEKAPPFDPVDAFEAATTTDDILAAFRALESQLGHDDVELGLVCLKVGQHLDSTGHPDQEKALSFAWRALEILERSSDRPITVAMALHLLGSVSYNLQRFRDSLGYLNRASKVLSKIDGEDNDAEMQSVVCTGEGRGCKALLRDLLQDTRKEGEKTSITLFEKLPQEQYAEANALARIGWLMLLIGKVQEGIPYLESAAERLKESFGPKHYAVGYIYNNLGAAYMELERPQSVAQMFCSELERPLGKWGETRRARSWCAAGGQRREVGAAPDRARLLRDGGARPRLEMEAESSMRSWGRGRGCGEGGGLGGGGAGRRRRKAGAGAEREEEEELEEEEDDGQEEEEEEDEEDDSPLAKERQLHLVQKELNKYKVHLNNCVRTRIEALKLLEKDKKTVDKLQQKLRIVNESKEEARKVTEDAKNQIKDLGYENSPGQFENNESWNQELACAREQYASAISELDIAKQELRKIKKDLESAREAKNSAIQQEVEAKHLADINSERADQLSEEMASIQESLVQVKLASSRAKQEESNIFSDSDTGELPYKLALEEIKHKLAFSKEGYDPELAVNLEAQLEKIKTEINSVQKDLENAKASDLASIAAVANMLEDAKSTLKLVMEEANHLRSLVETLNLELDETKRIQMELKRNEEETETLVGNLEAKLQKSKAKLEVTSVGESKAREACDDLNSTLNQLLSESENAKRVADTTLINTEQVKKEAQSARVALEEVEKQLHVALVEAEMSKTAEANALNQIKVSSEKANQSRNSSSESGARITISAEEFQSLSRRVEEVETLSKTKVDAAMEQIEELKISENGVIEKLEAISKETAAVELENEAAVNRAETAEAAMRAIEGEMKKLHDTEQKKVEETAARTLADMEVRVRASPPKVRVPRSSPSDQLSEKRLMRENSHATKRSFMPSFGLFHRKKNQPDVGSPSYVSGEKPGLLGVLD